MWTLLLRRDELEARCETAGLSDRQSAAGFLIQILDSITRDYACGPRIVKSFALYTHRFVQTTSAIALVLISSLILVAGAHTSQRAAATPNAPASRRPTFENIANQSGLEFQHTNGASPEKRMVETMGSGGLFFDYDNDGWLDVFLVNGGSIADRSITNQSRHRLYRNRGNATFEDVTAASGIAHTEYGLGACAADYDNDGRVDLYITNAGPNALYHNNGDKTFSDVTRAAGVGTPLLSTSCAFADIDNDGDVDLFVTNYVDLSKERPCGDARVRAYCRPELYQGLPNVLYRNNGNQTFTDVTREAGVYTTAGKGLGVVFGDYDDDGWGDFFVANDLAPNFLFHNKGHGVFSEVALLAGVSVASDAKARAGMGTDFGDVDGDGLLDLVVTNFMLEAHNIFRNLRGGLFADATFESGLGPATLPFVGFGATFLDYDNDGSLDLAIANGHVLDNADYFGPKVTYAQRNLLFRNEGAGRLREVGNMSGPGFALVKVSRGLAAGDVDNDGDLDLLVTNNGQTADLLRNDGGNGRNGILLHLVGTKSNRDGVGARVRVTAGGKTQVREVKAGSSYLSQNDLRAHFGLGAAAQIERVDIRWPSGTADVIRNVPVNHIVTIVEGKGLTETKRFAQRLTSQTQF
jgi:enediyne biosynthesis protein E4